MKYLSLGIGKKCNAFAQPATYCLTTFMVMGLTGMGNPARAISPGIVAQPSSAIVSSMAARSGQFQGIRHTVVGEAKLIEQNGQFYVELGPNFKTDAGPDLKVVLHNRNPVGAKLQAQDYQFLAPLTQAQGTQRYAIPSTVDVRQYGSVVIWCEAYNVTFGFAPLS
jgi:hypothetical protein